MANYWAIAIGINQYQHFQPLVYAQRDAQGFRDFLVREAAFSPQQCVLLTDSPPVIDRVGSYPNRDMIQTRLMQLCQQHLQPGDVLWVFFSGYGVQFEGKDYLMPIEGDPTEVEATGIPIEFLFSTFETAPTNNIFLVLDVNRSQSVLAGEGVGDQTALLAKEHGIPTLLSCPPDQVSHETLALRHGLFTSALIEGIRYRGCVTIEQVVQYLAVRLPELSDLHWRPRQDPLAVIPFETKYRLIVPETAAIALSATAQIPVGVTTDASLSQDPAQGNGGMSSGRALLAERSWIFPYPNPTPSSVAPTLLLNPDLLHPSAPTSPAPSVEPNSTQPTPLSSAPDRSLDTQDSLFWRRMLMWSGMVATVLLLGVVVRNCAILTGESRFIPGNPTTPQSNQLQGNSGPTYSVSPNIQTQPGSPLESAYLAIRAGQFGEAKQHLAQVPDNQRNQDYRKLLEQANKGLLSDAKILLTRSREVSFENQASDFVEAITVVRQIRADEPQYPEAQVYIDRWSRVILDMAQGRADRRNGESTPVAAANYNDAIAAARLIPDDRPEVYNQAQQAIDHWSEKIFDLAKTRADEGLYEVAILAAELVPPDTVAYPAAQEAIAEWRTKPSSVIENIPAP
ncbi:MAG: hypothetical protein HC769_00410 [Cyanobacteria bacterium CRU_2_1]|nr:hypothetical protein [Cyanobacteria bacterium RU_5_0]NJR57436.1 hypothetical protein [Cyanobacteria bacterium CRU_2_1]